MIIGIGEKLILFSIQKYGCHLERSFIFELKKGISFQYKIEVVINIIVIGE